MKATMITALRALALIAAFAAISAAGAGVKYVAVVETEVNAASGASAKINKAEVQEVTTVLRNEARNILPPDKYKIMTSETVIAQGGAVLEECAEENCVITLGSKIGADYIVRGSVSKVGTKLTLSIVVYETEDGTLVASSRVSSEKVEELLDKTVTACGEMYRKFDSETVAAEKRKMDVTQQQQAVTPATITAPTPTPQSQNQPSVPKPSTVSAITPTPTKPTTLDASGILTDGRDGKKYKTVVIGGKRWMGENLNYQTTGGSWCYGNDNSNCGRYGRLYDWNTAKTVCPRSWHLPSRQEWDALVKVAGGKKAGKALKSVVGWINNGNGTDDYGFSATPSGYRLPAVTGRFDDLGNEGRWWTAEEFPGGSAFYRNMYYHADYVYEYGYSKDYGFSVRCVAD